MRDRQAEEESTRWRKPGDEYEAGRSASTWSGVQMKTKAEDETARLPRSMIEVASNNRRQCGYEEQMVVEVRRWPCGDGKDDRVRWLAARSDLGRGETLKETIPILSIQWQSVFVRIFAARL